MGLLEAEVVLKDAKVVELEWTSRNFLLEIDSNALKVIKLLRKDEVSFPKIEVFIENIPSVNDLFHERRTRSIMLLRLWHPLKATLWSRNKLF